MSGYIGTQPVPQATQTRDSFTATSGQTSFATSGYTPNFLDVYLNGVKLAAADYTASNGSDVVLASGAATGDILEVVAYTAFDAGNVTSSSGFTVSGNFSADGGTIKLDGNYPVGTDNVALGDTALDSLTSGNFNTVFGAKALTSNTEGSFNVGVGRLSLTSNTTGQHNAGIGADALQGNTTGSYNTALGNTALQANTTASNNTAVGYQAGYSNTTGTGIVAIGESAGYSNTTSHNNISIGQAALYANTGSSNTAIGATALRFNTTANNSVAVGYRAGYLSTAQHNTFIGYGSGETVTTGQKNTIIGRYDGNQGGLDIRGSNNNIVLSDGDGNPRGIFNSSGDFYVNSYPSPGAGVGGFIAGVTGGILVTAGNGMPIFRGYSYNSGTPNVQINENGNVVNANNSYGAISDEKLKENIVDSGSQWDDIKDLTVRKYSLKADNLDAPNQLGVIAQELEALGMGGLVNTFTDIDSDGNDLGTVTKSVNYSVLYMKAVKALQEAMTRIETLETKVTALEG